MADAEKGAFRRLSDLARRHALWHETRKAAITRPWPFSVYREHHLDMDTERRWHRHMWRAFESYVARYEYCQRQPTAAACDIAGIKEFNSFVECSLETRSTLDMSMCKCLRK